MRYLDFDLWIDNRVGDHYPLRAACPAQGEAQDRTALDPESGPLHEFETRLGSNKIGKELLVKLGSLLYAGVFDAENRDIGRLFERSRGACNAERDKGLRVRLRIEAPSMAHLPWELLYSRQDREFLATNEATAIVRYLEVPQPIRSLETSFPVRMLVVIPAVKNLNTAAERKFLEEAVGNLERQKLIELTWLDGIVTLDRVSDALLEQRFHILHFIGHGGFQSEQPFLILNRTAEDFDFVGHERFGSLFRNHPTMKLIVLNSCQGAEVSLSQPLLGLAPELVRCGIPAVIAMQFRILDTAAIRFAREFYMCLFKGPKQGRLEPAISHARNRLNAEFPEYGVVATPVLFTRAPEGVLFELLTGKPLKDIPYSPRQLAGVEAANRTREANLVLLEDDAERHVEIAELKRSRARIRFRNLSLVLAMAMAFFLFFVSSFKGLGQLDRELQLQLYSSWLGNGFSREEFSDQITLVATRQTIDKSWRRRHAVLLDRLSAAGATVVVFDVEFSEPDDQADNELAAAMNRAASRNTAVVVAVGRLEGEAPGLSPILRPAITSWGVACLGQSLAPSPIVPLVTQKGNSTLSPRVPALALAAVLAFQRARPSRIHDLGGFSDDEETHSDQPNCPAINPGDRVYHRIIALSSAKPLRLQRLWYEDLAAPLTEATAALVRGKIVVVGEQTARWQRFVLRGLIPERRYSMELQADAINTLLSGITIRPASGPWQFVLTLLMAMAGAYLRYRNPDPLLRQSALAGFVLMYLAGAVILYVTSQLLLNTVFHLGAFLLTYLGVGRLQRRFWP